MRSQVSFLTHLFELMVQSQFLIRAIGRANTSSGTAKILFMKPIETKPATHFSTY